MSQTPARVLVCPQEFKGSLSAAEAASAIARGIRAAWPDADVTEAPMADGGPGTAEIVRAARGGEWVEERCTGPLDEEIEARFALVDDGREAVIEAAATVGLVLVPEEQRDPGRGWSYGLGQQIRFALDRGVERILIGVGGTGTNDGGAGAASALGYRLLDVAGDELPSGPLHLERLARIDASGVDGRLSGVDVRVAVDVRNPLLGPEGATAVYGPQKGVTPELRPRLEAALERWAEVVRRDLGVDIASIEGGGAGGGLAAGLAAACGASVESGAALVAGEIGLEGLIAATDLVVTGEGRLDTQTGYGKAVAHVVGLAAAHERRCVAVAGSIAAFPSGIEAAEAAASGIVPAEAMARAAELVEAAARRLADDLPF
ncbi:MAG: glycerate kinase [Dehalococcoidia bacterium]